MYRLFLRFLIWSCSFERAITPNPKERARLSVEISDLEGQLARWEMQHVQSR